MEAIMIARNVGENGLSEEEKRRRKIFVILESVIVTFLITMTGEMMNIGHFPNTLHECWMPFLTSFLMALYAYIRVSGISIPEVKKGE